MSVLRHAALIVAATAVLPVLQPTPAPAEWWRRAPVDFEECAEQADKAPTKEEKRAGLAECSSKFAGRRKAGGGYVYYDFLQDRSFDIAGPNPTPKEQKYIDQQYALYLEKQRRSSLEAAFTARQQEEQQQEEQRRALQQASLRTEPERVPIPQARPSKQIANQGASNDNKPRNCQQHSFSCEWPHLSETIQDLKKLFGVAPSKGKKS